MTFTVPSSVISPTTVSGVVVVVVVVPALVVPDCTGLVSPWLPLLPPSILLPSEAS
ncbi:MAG: hypothetical protein ACLSFT_02000 [Ruminococcus callidus]